jgi:hypothetical protein
MRTSRIIPLLVGAMLAAFTYGAGCGGGETTPDIDAGPPDAAPPGGTLSLMWSLSDGQGTVSCDLVKAAQVVLTLTPVGGGPGFTDLFSCSSAQGTGMPHPPSSYNVKIELKNASGQVMSSATQNGVTITSGQTTQMNPVTFTVSKTGGLRFKLDVAATSGTNCDDEQGNPAGAGISKFRIELQKSGACVPATLMVPAGGMGEPAQTITLSCPGGGVGSCIEIDQEATATGLVAGDYAIKVTGLENAADDECYTGTGTTSVSGGDVVKNAGTVNVTLLTDNGMPPMPKMNCTGP